MTNKLTQLPSGNYVQLDKVLSVFVGRERDGRYPIYMETPTGRLLADWAISEARARTTVRVLAEMVSRAGDPQSEPPAPPTDKSDGMLCTPGNITRECECGSFKARKLGRSWDRMCMHPDAIAARVAACRPVTAAITCEPSNRTQQDCKCSVEMAIARAECGDKICKHIAASFVRAAMDNTDLGTGGSVADEDIVRATELLKTPHVVVPTEMRDNVTKIKTAAGLEPEQGTAEETTQEDFGFQSASTGATYNALLEKNKKLEEQLSAAVSKIKSLTQALVSASLIDKDPRGIRVRDVWCQGLDTERLLRISKSLKEHDAEAWAIGHLIEQLIPARSR